jgi:hypothetical protein
MATADQSSMWFHIDPFWDDEYKSLDYIKEQFNDPFTVTEWQRQGHSAPFGGVMCDMRGPQPSWNDRFVRFFEDMGWQDIGTSYYRMDTGHTLPTHVDTYQRYIELFDLQDRPETIRRAIVFLEAWQPGHYSECMGRAYSSWEKGFTLLWSWDTPHLAANLGPTPRYTLQITGHV